MHFWTDFSQKGELIVMRNWQPVKRHPSIYKYSVKHGDRYGIRRVWIDSEKKRHEFTKSGFRTIKDAEVVLTQFEDSLYKGKKSPLKNSKVTFDEYFNKIKERSIKLGKWRIDTVKTKDQYYKNHIHPRFGNVALSKITRAQYQSFIDELITNGYAKTTIRTIDGLMQLIMNDAEVYDVIYKNNLKHISISGGKPAKNLTLEDVDYKKWLTQAEKMVNKYKMSMIQLFALGERREELLGLHLGSFDFSTDTSGKEICKITFDRGRTIHRLNGGPLKTKASYRSIYVTGEVIESIKYAIEQCKNICDKFGIEINDDTFLYRNEITGDPIHPTYPTRLFKSISDKCGVKIHPHKLRHYFATSAKDSNLADTAVAKWLGHANVQMTNKYARPNKNSVLRVYDGVKEQLDL